LVGVATMLGVATEGPEATVGVGVGSATGAPDWLVK
jgi:hypothetical protein